MVHGSHGTDTHTQTHTHTHIYLVGGVVGFEQVCAGADVLQAKARLTREEIAELEGGVARQVAVMAGVRVCVCVRGVSADYKQTTTAGTHLRGLQ